jgi:hypothetical protein
MARRSEQTLQLLVEAHQGYGEPCHFLGRQEGADIGSHDLHADAGLPVSAHADLFLPLLICARLHTFSVMT